MGFRNKSNFVLCLGLIYGFILYTPGMYDVFASFSVALVALKLAEWLMATTRTYFLYKKVSPINKAVLITGCDSGFGHMLAKRMDKLGYHVFAGCLFPSGDGATELQNTCSSRLRVVEIDVTSDKSVQEAKNYVAQNLGGNVLWALVNNAGVSQAGEIEWTPIEEFQKVFAVNTEGMLRVTKAFLPLIKECKGRIVNNTSLCGHFTCPGYVGYCMSKTAAVSFTTGLRIEMMKWGVKCSSIEPFFYKTPITGKEFTLGLIENTWRKADPEVREQYGEAYLEAFKENCSRLLDRSSDKVEDVLSCFEDAITAQEPLSTYFPCYLLHKLGLKLLRSLPDDITSAYKKAQLLGDSKVAALQKKRYRGPAKYSNGIGKTQ